MSFFIIHPVDKSEYLNLIYDAGIEIEADQQTMLRAMNNSSYVWQGWVDGDLIGLMGTVPSSLLGDSAYIWFFATAEFKEHSFTAIWHSRQAIDAILNVYPILRGHCVVSEQTSRRWLRFLGATFGDPQDQLIPFEIRAAA